MQKKIVRIGMFCIFQCPISLLASLLFEEYVYYADGYIVAAAVFASALVCVLSVFWMKRLDRIDAERQQLEHQAWVRLNEKLIERNRYFDDMFLDSKPFGRYSQTRAEAWRIATAFN